MREKIKQLSPYRSYLIGFFLSIVLTVLAFGLTVLHEDSGHLFINHNLIIPVVLLLAFTQLIVQLTFFLHLGRRDQSTRWNLIFFIATFGLVLMVVIASLIIMNNLNYSHVTPESATEYIIIDEGIEVNESSNY